MANRSYLYSTNVVPGAADGVPTIIGISEWNYDIPLAYKLLLSGNPTTCKSAIWDNTEEIAVVGDYDSGVEQLSEFLEEVQLPAAQPLIQETLAFLGNPRNRQKYFLLECGEIFDLRRESLASQITALATDIADVGSEAERALTEMRKQSNPGFFAKLFGKGAKPGNELDPVYKLGLGNWCNTLYFDLSRK